jgi:hypothetical protein
MKGGTPTMYVTPNMRTKKALKEAVARAEHVNVFSPGPFPCPTDGKVPVEGPHYPEPHTWYATVLVEGGRVVKVLT